MKEKEFNYYLMQDRGIVAKGVYFDNWIFDFESRSWVKDTKYIISDALMGYDPGEPEGSPYGVGSTSEMDEIKHIDYKTAMQFISDTIVQNLIKKWKENMRRRRLNGIRNLNGLQNRFLLPFTCMANGMSSSRRTWAGTKHPSMMGSWNLFRKTWKRIWLKSERLRLQAQDSWIRGS